MGLNLVSVIIATIIKMILCQFVNEDVLTNWGITLFLIGIIFGITLRILKNNHKFNRNINLICLVGYESMVFGTVLILFRIHWYQ